MGKTGGPPPAAHAAEDLWGEALKRWYEQERSALPPPEEDAPPNADRPFPPGWWLLPSLAMSLGIWGVILWMSFG